MGSHQFNYRCADIAIRASWLGLSTSEYFGSRWQARVPFASLFWNDLILRGSLLNLFFSILGLVFIAQGYPAYLGLTAHFLMLPYNLFLVLCVWRLPEVKTFFKAMASGWFVLMIFV